MEIKTKYNIGDKVWVFSDGDIQEFNITDITIYCHQNIPITVYYINENDEGFTEESVFSTKELLINAYEKMLE